MTLTHILPSLRRSLPNPLDQDCWPEFTTTSSADVTIAGVSLTRLAEWCGTPCVHTAAAVVPGTGGLPSPDELTSVIVVRVVAVDLTGDGSADAWIDARLSDSRVVIQEARLIGRVSTAPDFSVRVKSPYDDTECDVVFLQSDLQRGDLVAIPCRGTALLRNVDPGRNRLVRDSGEPDGFSVPSHCGR